MLVVGRNDQDFFINARRDAGTEVLIVSGDVDLFTSRRLRAELEFVIRRSKRAVAIDLGEAATIDTHGLAALRDAAQRLAAQGREFTVVGASPGVLRALDVTRLRDDLPLAASLQHASG